MTQRGEEPKQNFQCQQMLAPCKYSLRMTLTKHFQAAPLSAVVSRELFAAGKWPSQVQFTAAVCHFKHLWSHKDWMYLNLLFIYLSVYLFYYYFFICWLEAVSRKCSQTGHLLHSQEPKPPKIILLLEVVPHFSTFCFFSPLLRPVW